MSTEPTFSLYRKLAEVMGECGYVKKNGYNKFHAYHYVTEADLVDAVRDKLSKRNVVLIPSVVDIAEREIVSEKGKHSTLTTIRVSFTFVDGDTGEVHQAEWMGAGDDGADKGLYKAYTGAVKYFLMKTFLIPTGDDPEADTKADERAATRAAPKTNGNGSPVIPRLSEEKRDLVLGAIRDAKQNPALILAAVGLEKAEDMTAAHAREIKVILDGTAVKA